MIAHHSAAGIITTTNYEHRNLIKTCQRRKTPSVISDSFVSQSSNNHITTTIFHNLKQHGTMLSGGNSALEAKSFGVKNRGQKMTVIHNVQAILAPTQVTHRPNSGLPCLLLFETCSHDKDSRLHAKTHTHHYKKPAYTLFKLATLEQRVGQCCLRNSCIREVAFLSDSTIRRCTHGCVSILPSQESQALAL